MGGTKGAAFTEAVNLDGVPDGLQGIAHNPGNKLSTKRQATFVLDGGAWKLQSRQLELRNNQRAGRRFD